ncbi:MAG: hypothetical protein ABIP97_12190 [Chthoniobacterales bacterium]
MAAIYQRRHTWWIRFYHPRTGKLVRESLGTPDSARAELLRQRVELEAALLEPRLQAAELPAAVSQALGTPVSLPVIEVSATPVLPSVQIPRVSIEVALKSYIDFIRADNAPRHVDNKLSMLRRFLGTGRVEPFVISDNAKHRGLRLRKSMGGHFKGEFLDEITPSVLQEFFTRLEVSIKTKRHYREFFHHLFEFCIKFGLYRPENWHCPNPAAALPTYLSRNRRIIYLGIDQVDEQLAALENHPAFQMAAAIMIHAGLRRAEALWLTRDAISPDLSFLSVVNRVDPENDLESSLKTGDRSVTILPPLKRMLEAYLPTLSGEWLIPKPGGGRWNGDAFAKRLKDFNTQAELKWTCLHYRHTYATQRAAQGWSLLRIAHEMGNSVAIVAEYYAAYMRPVEIGAPVSAPVLSLVERGAA